MSSATAGGASMSASAGRISRAVRVDAHQIQRVLVNLIENALKYSPDTVGDARDARRRLRCSSGSSTVARESRHAISNGSSSLSSAVRMAPAAAPDSASRSRAASPRRTRAASGPNRARGREPTFVLALPADRSRGDEVSGPRVLVVDDEQQILRALQTSLRGAGYEVDTAETAADGARRSRDTAARSGDSRPDPPGRHRVGRPARAAQVELGAGDRPFGRGRRAGEGSGPGRGRRRLRDEAGRDRRAARPAARRLATDDPFGRAGDRDRRSRRRPRRSRRSASAARRPPDAARVRPAPDPRAKRGQATHPPHAPARGLGTGLRGASNLLHVNVSQLRRKIEPDRARPRYLLTEPGAGYRLVDPTTRS